MTGYPRVNADQVGLRANDVRLRVKNGFPLLFLGGACTFAAIVLLQNGLQIHAVRVPIWLLSLSVGAVALLGGIIALVAGDFEDRRPGTDAKLFSPGDDGEDWAQETAPAPARKEEAVVPAGAWDHFNRSGRQSVGTPSLGSTPVLASSAIPSRDSPASMLFPPGPTRPARPTDKRGKVPQPDGRIEELLSDLEMFSQETDRGKSKADLLPRIERLEAASSDVVSEVPPKSVDSKPTERLSSKEKQRRPSPRKEDLGPAQTPSGLPDELAELLSEFYPDIQTGSHPGVSRARSQGGREVECPECGRKIGETPGEIRCFRCSKPMCGRCRDRAISAKRTLLCKSCFATYGVGSPAG